MPMDFGVGGGGGNSGSVADPAGAPAGLAGSGPGLPHPQRGGAAVFPGNGLRARPALTPEHRHWAEAVLGRGGAAGAVFR